MSAQPVPAEAGRPDPPDQHDGPDECHRGAAEEEGRPQPVLGRSRMHRHVVGAEREHREHRPADSGGDLRPPSPELEGSGHAAADRRHEAEPLQAADVVAVDGDAPDHRDAGRERRDRGDDADRSRRHAAIEREQPDRPQHSRERRPRHLVAGNPRAADDDRDRRARASPNGCDAASTVSAGRPAPLRRRGSRRRPS